MSGYANLGGVWLGAPEAGDALRATRLVQSDFGGYDARFPGVTMRLATPRAWQLLLGTPADEAAEAVERSRAEGFEAFFETLALTTLWPHETRHVHDNLVSPAGSKVFWHRLMLALYGMQLTTRLTLSDDRDQVIPVPIPKWLRADPATRDSWLAGWRSYTGSDVQVAPLLCEPADDPALNSLLATIADHSDSLRELFIDPPTIRSRTGSLHLSEASALVIQFAAIQLRFGNEAAGHFLGAVQTVPNAAYGRALQQLIGLVQLAGIDRVDLPTLCAIATWSLLGDVYERPGDRPIRRYARLGQLLVDAGIPDGREVGDAERLFEQWDARTDHPSTLSGVESALHRDEQLLAATERALASQGPGPARMWMELLLPLAREWVAARRHMIESFLADPGHYCDPIGYLTGGAERYPIPPAVYTVEGLGVSSEFVERAGLTEAGYLVLETISPVAPSSEPPRVIAIGAPRHELVTIDVEKAYEFSRWQLLTDFLFGEFRRDLGEYEQTLADAALRERGLRPLEILD